MRTQTSGIVLRYFRYGENGMIAHIYTQNYGRQTFLFKGAKSRSAKRKLSFLQPLALVEIPMDYRPEKELYAVNGAYATVGFQSIPFQQIKSSSAFFLAEILSRLLQIHESDKPLFSFLENAIQFLDDKTTKGANFHLTFLVKLQQFLGIQPNFEENDFFGVVDAKEYLPLWQTFQNATWEKCDCLALSRDQRNEFLQKLLHYYSFHLQDLSGLKSLAVLQEVFQ